MGPVHEGCQSLQVGESEAGDESSKDLEIFWRCEESYNRIFYRELQMKVWRLRLRGKNLNCRKILPSVFSAMRSSFRKCGFRRSVGPVHEAVSYTHLTLPTKRIV